MKSSTHPAPIELTRDQLHEKVWSTPATRLAQEFGISDVALAKTCKRLNIPRPERGHWARLASGQKLKRPALPAGGPDQPVTIQFDVEANLTRRAEWAQPQPGPHAAPVIQSIDLSLPPTAWHAVAQSVSKAMEKAKPEKDGRVEIKRKDLPHVLASKEQVARIAAAIDALIRLLEPHGIKLVEGADNWIPALRFAKGEDWLSVGIEERTFEVEQTPTAEDKRRPSWTWQKATGLAGKLTFRLSSNHTLRGRREWTESGQKPLEEVLPIVSAKMKEFYDRFEQERIDAAEAAKRRAAQEREWEKQRKREEHKEALVKIAKRRAKNLRRASEWWAIYNQVLGFIKSCEDRWRAAAEGELIDAQQRWLAWARERADNLCPFSDGYPDLSVDGPFDPSSIRQGGPYPETRKVPNPPSMQQHSSHSSGSSANYGESSKPYPFWLRHQRH